MRQENRHRQQEAHLIAMACSQAPVGFARWTLRLLANPDTEVITVIHDQLNTHVPCALYERFEATEARRILDKLDFHYTPKHGSWLNMAEIELSV